MDKFLWLWISHLGVTSGSAAKCRGADGRVVRQGGDDGGEVRQNPDSPVGERIGSELADTWEKGPSLVRVVAMRMAATLLTGLTGVELAVSTW